MKPGFDWNQLFTGGQTVSLFAEKRLMELRIPTGKPGDAGAKALIDYATSPHSADTVLIIVAGAIEKRTQGSKWFKALESEAVVTECPTISSDKLPDWIAIRIANLGLRYDRDAVRRIAHHVEGNLLAAAQEINLLALLAKDQFVSLDLVESTISDHARFNVFAFVDACLLGSPHRLIRILQSLRQEQSEPILILWSLAREARTLCRLSAIQEQGGNPRSQFQRYGVWGNRTGLMASALKRLSPGQCRHLLRRLAHADLTAKGPGAASA